jgi:BlaI family penicillinase repressor
MARQKSAQPTPVELQILGTLWDHGPQTARQIHERLQSEKPSAYSTTVTMLSVMLEKKLVGRDDTAQPQVYRAARSRSVTQRKLLQDLAQRAFDGSLMSLVMQALSTHRATADEVQEMRQILDSMESES